MSMMTNREELHDILVEILGSSHVYFNPPEGLKLKYPAIVYHRNKISHKCADDVPYIKMVSYTVTVIDDDPDSEIVEKISELPSCEHSTNFTLDGMNHDVFIINI